MKYFKVQEVARDWGVSPACIYSLVSEGSLECFRIGTGRGTLRFTQEQLDRYLEGCSTQALPLDELP